MNRRWPACWRVLCIPGTAYEWFDKCTGNRKNRLWKVSGYLGGVVVQNGRWKRNVHHKSKAWRKGEQYLVDLKFKGIDAAQSVESLALWMLSERLVVQSHSKSVSCSKLPEVVSDALKSYDRVWRKSRNKDCRFIIKGCNVVSISAADSWNPLKKNLFGSFKIHHGTHVLFSIVVLCQHKKP